MSDAVSARHLWPRQRVVEFTSPLSIEDCRFNLQAGMDRPPAWRGIRPIVGEVDGTKLRARKRIAYRNAFQTYLTAQLSEREGGTFIRCRCSMHPLVKAFLAFWFGCVIFAGLAAVALPLVGFGQTSPRKSMGPEALVPLCMLVCGGALVLVGRSPARQEAEYLLDFVRTTTKARSGGGNRHD